MLFAEVVAPAAGRQLDRLRVVGRDDGRDEPAGAEHELLHRTVEALVRDLVLHRPHDRLARRGGVSRRLEDVRGEGDVEIGERLLREIYAKPFQAAITEAGLRGVMPCYCSVNGLPMHASRKYLTGLLREEMGFDGVTVSDYGGAENTFLYQKTSESKGEAGYRCLKAGLDVELPMPAAFREMKALFENGEADEAYLDAAVLRVLEAKFRMGLFENPYSLEGTALEETVHHAHDDEVSFRAAQQSIILLKNKGVLPLTGREKTIAVIGPHAGNARYYFGGYTHLSMVEAMHAAVNSMAGTGGGGDSR